MEGLEIAVAFGQVVREARTAQGFSQEGFADHVGVHRTYMGIIERGKSVVTLYTAHRVAKGLNISLAELIERVESSLSATS